MYELYDLLIVVPFRTIGQQEDTLLQCSISVVVLVYFVESFIYAPSSIISLKLRYFIKRFHLGVLIVYLNEFVALRLKGLIKISLYVLEIFIET